MGGDQAESLLTWQVGRPLQGGCCQSKQCQQFLTRFETELGMGDQIKGLLDLLGRHPTAINLAGAFIKEANSSISDYLERYRSPSTHLAKAKESSNPPVDTSLKESVLVTTTISYDHIRLEDETAASFLRLWTYLDHRALWYELFTPDFPLPVQAESFWWFRSAIETQQGFAKAMQVLQAYGMILGKENSSSYLLPPVISESAQQGFSKDRDSEIAWLAVRTVGRATPEGSAQEDSVLKQRLKFHACCCYRLIVDDVAVPYFTLKNPFLPKGFKLDTALIYFSALDRLGNFYAERMMTVEANNLLQRSSQGYSEILGAENAVTLDVISRRAKVLVAGDKLNDAEELYLQVFKGYENSPGSGLSLMWQAAYSLAGVQQKLDKLDSAEATYRQTLNGLETAMGPDHSFTIRIVRTLGDLCLSRERLEEAGKLYLRALPILRKARSLEYIMLLQSLRDLAVAYLRTGKAVEAEQMTLVCLQEHEEIPLADPSLYLEILVLIGEMYRDQGKPDQAERIFLRALEGYEQSPTDHQENIANTAYNLANFYTFQDKVKEAEVMVVKALEAYKNSLGADHHYTLDALNNLANIQNRQGKTAEAEETYLQVLASKERALGPEHRKTLETITNLGVFYDSQDKAVEAKKMYIRALDGFKTVLGPTHSISLNVLINMGSLYASLGRLHDSVRAYLQALDGYQAVLFRLQAPKSGSDARSLGAEPASDGNRLPRYAQYSAKGDEDVSTFIPGVTSTMQQLETLTQVILEQRNLMEAEKVLLRLLKAKGLVFGFGHPSTEGILGTLLRVLYARSVIGPFTEKDESQNTTEHSQGSSPSWADPNPIWRLAHLGGIYGQSFPNVFGFLGKALIQTGGEQNARIAFQLEVVQAMDLTGELGCCCD
jgi:tetratricopeptide (TPR) repeat protein